LDAVIPAGLERLRREAEAALGFDQPRLNVCLEAAAVVIEGTFLLTAETPLLAEHEPLAEYEVRVEILPGYPVAEPVVFETAGAFPHDTAHHVYDNNRCCVLVWESWTATAADLSIRAFFEGPLRNYFLGQYAVAHGGTWPFGERAHGAEGLAQAYAERLGCAPHLKTVNGFLKGLIKLHGRRALPVYWQCPCGSGRHIGQCCGERLPSVMATVSCGEAEAMLARLAPPRLPITTRPRQGRA
jgi:hypothetical protein